MILEDIIECLNKHIQSRRDELNIKNKSFLVLQRSSKCHSQFKVYKEYNSTIWLVTNSSRVPILTINHIARVVNGDENKVKDIIDQKLMIMIFDMVHSNSYTDIINGTYKAQ